MDVQEFQLYIGGRSVSAASGATYESMNPYTGEPWALVPEADVADVDHAVAAGQHLIGKGAVTATEIEHAAVGRNAQQARDIDGGLPNPAADMGFDVGTAIHGLAIALLARPIPVTVGFAVGSIAGHGLPLPNPRTPTMALGRAGVACQEILRMPTVVLFRR